MSFESHKDRWDSLGVTNVARSTLSDANTDQPGDIYKKMFYSFLEKCTASYINKKGELKIVTVLTNNLKLAESTIAALYRGRWDIENFFLWIKQNLRIKTFIGTSPNAVMTQVWVAMILYLLLSFIKFQTRFNSSLSDLLKIIKEILIEQKSLIEYLRLNWDKYYKAKLLPVQLSFL